MGLAAASGPAPERAWIIVALGWEYNDEWSYQEGENPQKHVYFEKETAEAECRRLCDEFFAEQTPAEFQIDWDCYLTDRRMEPGFDETKVTWDEVRADGFPDPYYVLELTQPGEEDSDE
jgi:hypothetical protein